MTDSRKKPNNKAYLEIEDLRRVRLEVSQLAIEDDPARVLLTSDLHVDFDCPGGAVRGHDHMVVPVRPQNPRRHHAVGPARTTKEYELAMTGYCAAMSNMGTSLCPLNMISEYLHQGHANPRSHISNKVFPPKKKIVARLNHCQKIKTSILAT